MTNSELAAWIASKVPEGHYYRCNETEIQDVLDECELKSPEVVRFKYDSRQIAIGLMLDALAEAGVFPVVRHFHGISWRCLWNIGAGEDEYWDWAIGESRYAAARAACEAVAANPVK